MDLLNRSKKNPASDCESDLETDSGERGQSLIVRQKIFCWWYVFSIFDQKLKD